jgi:hypothetical protein
MASILFGVTVIPAQAARLFEALLEFQEERKRKQAQSMGETMRLKREKSRADEEVDGKIELKAFLKERYDKGELLDSRISCHSCGARCHRIDSIYCFSCGEKL